MKVRTRRVVPGLVVVVLGTALAVGSAVALAAPSGASAAPYCGQAWGSLPERDADLSRAVVTDVRAGRHACFDRLVVDLRGDVAGHSVRYVSAVRSDGSGHVVPVRGGARLQVTVTAPAHDAAYRSTYRPADRRELVDVAGWRTFRQAAWAGSYEGYTTIGLGVRARLPFRVLVLDGPGTGSRLVVDVAHRW